MMLRFVFTLILHYCFTIIGIPPTTGEEMGKMKGDKENLEDKKPNKYLYFITNQSAIYILSIFNTIMYYDEPLILLDYLMVLLCIFGLYISLYAYHTLKRLYTFDIGIREDHHIITDGPYRYIAHPGYCGQLSLFIGMIIYWRIDILLTIPLLVYILYLFYRRIKNEEKMLINHFGQEYHQYLGKRKRLIPFII